MSALRPHLFSSFVALVLGGLCTIGCSGAETQDVLMGTSSSGGGGASSGASGASSGGSGAPTCATPEQEPNNDRSQANVLSPTRCGTLSASDPKDFLTFKLPAGTKEFAINFSGQVRLKVDIEGKQAVELTPQAPGTVPIVIGKAYMIEVDPLSGTDATWTVTIVVK